MFDMGDEIAGGERGGFGKEILRAARAAAGAHHAVAENVLFGEDREIGGFEAVFWHFAGRWGRVRGDGVLLPLRLTHTVLADLVAACRSTVTTALSDLSKRGLIRPVDEGWLLLGEAPTGARAMARASESASS